MNEIENIAIRELLDMYESEIQRLHYDPCDSYDRARFDCGDMRKEIERRIGILDESGNL